jgi:hypothetical protein
VLEDGNINRKLDLPGETPNLSTRKELKAVDDRHNPISIFIDLETAIRMEFLDFKDKWDAALPS